MIRLYASLLGKTKVEIVELEYKAHIRQKYGKMTSSRNRGLNMAETEDRAFNFFSRITNCLVTIYTVTHHKSLLPGYLLPPHSEKQPEHILHTLKLLPFLLKKFPLECLHFEPHPRLPSNLLPHLLPRRRIVYEELLPLLLPGVVLRILTPHLRSHDQRSRPVSQ